MISTSGTGASSEVADQTAGAKQRRRGETTKYGEAGFRGGQPRVSELIPRSYLAMGLLFFGGLAVIAGLEAIYFYMPRLAAGTSDGSIAAFDLDGEGSLAVWFSSLLLGLAALVGLLIYSIRRFKADDYHGRYRVWLWASLIWFVMSVDEAASLHEGFKELMTQTSGTRILGDGSIWWVLAYGLVWLALGTRLCFQLTACRGAMFCFFCAAACFAGAVATQLEWLLPQNGARGIMVEEGLEMAGDLLLLLSTLLFARFAILESRGEIGGQRTPRRRERRRAAPLVTDLENPSPRSAGPAASAKVAPPMCPASQSTLSSVGPPREQLRVDGAHGQPQRRLSKAERRALRRAQRTERD